MDLSLELVADDGSVVTLAAPLELSAGRYRLRYATRTGALVACDGLVRGAFDREHDAIELDLANGASRIELTVERRSLPAAGLPSGDGARWRAMLARAEQEPALAMTIEPLDGEAVAERARPADAPRAARDETPLDVVGHAHLDVAWLWTYAEARRKAARTFATAVRQLDLDVSYVFAQSQPQLYAWVEADQPALFERVACVARAGRFDASGAALWVEPDANIPSGESLLRQLAFGKRYVIERFGVEPTVAWLPDTFGFAATLPQLFRHAGVDAFATTKLQWNDTTRFPHPRFWWIAPDGSRVLAALFAAYEGDDDERRRRIASERDEPLVVGYGDGGGGPTDAIVRRASGRSRWTSLGAWFARARERAANEALPEHRDELYLEYHRGVFTTNRRLKVRNAALERRLREIEELGAWARAIHASPFYLDEFRTQIRDAWEIVLRAQFHDVIAGTVVAEVVEDVHAEYDRAEALLAHLEAGIRSILPRAPATPRVERRDLAPLEESSRGVRGAPRTFLFENARVFARVREDGAIVHLRSMDARVDRATTLAPSAVVLANVLRAYRDRPAKWDAWNIDAGYWNAPLRVRFDGAEVVDDALEVRFAVGKSPGVMRISLAANEPFLRVELALAWDESHVLLRLESDLALRDARARFGAPHGVVDRALEDRSTSARAKFEVPGQRYARIDGTHVARGAAAGVALFSLDGYGWSARATANDRIMLGHSLVRAPRWPDPTADRGEQTMSLAYVPLASDVGNGEVEALWQRFAASAELAMFSSDDPAIAIVATKLADDGDGVIVRARECDGVARDATIRCAARANAAVECDALERELDAEPSARAPYALREGALETRFAPYQLRTFRVRLA